MFANSSVMVNCGVVEGISENPLCFPVVMVFIFIFFSFPFYFFFPCRLLVMELEGQHSFKASMSWNANCGRFMVI